jgi:RNA polymerase sigma factor, sigma-70 family
MKYAPKKVFVLENGNYKEITYEELCLREKNDESYKNKLFLPMYGILMEVTKKDYSEYYQEERRKKYISECAKENGELSYNALDTDEFKGEDSLIDSTTDVINQVEEKLMIEKLRKVLPLLSKEEQQLIQEHFFDEVSQVELSRKYGLNQSNISRRIGKILLKLKKFLES